MDRNGKPVDPSNAVRVITQEYDENGKLACGCQRQEKEQIYPALSSR